MKFDKIRVISHDNYEISGLCEKLEILFSSTGLFEELGSKKVRKILLKPNILGIYPPETATITHPNLVAAAAKVLKAKGYSVGVGDSSGMLIKNESILSSCGYDAIFKEGSASYENFDMEPFDRIRVNEKEVYITGVLGRYDYCISMPKFKTHHITTITCCIKNFYGIVPGVKKTHYHREFHKFRDFCLFMTGLYSVVRADYYLVDSILAMEGDGPAGGSPRKLDMLAVGRDGAKIDAYLLKLMGVEADKLEYYSNLRSLGLYSGIGPEDIEAEPDLEERFGNFQLPSSTALAALTSTLPQFVFNFLRIRPRIDGARCVRCRECERKCPVGAIVYGVKRMKILDHKCIACGCCKEVCSAEAIHMRPNLIMRVFGFLRGIYERARYKKRQS